MHFYVKVPENGRKNIFRKYQTTNKVPRNMFRKFEVRKKMQFLYRRPKNSMKSKCYVFNDYKQRNKACLCYLECKLQPDRYG